MKRRDFIQTGIFAMPVLADGLRNERVGGLKAELSGAKPGKAKIRALFVTDMHLSPGIERSRAAGEFLLDYIGKHPEIDMVINGGDSVYDVAKLNYPAGEDQWQFWRSFRDRIKIPVHNCLGNHDIYEWELSKEEIARPQDSKASAVKHLDMPESYYAFRAGRWKFIVLDSLSYVVKGYKGALDSAQLKWLAGELEKDMDHRIAVISHIPILSACTTLYLDPDRNYLYPKIAERLTHTDAPFIFDVLKNRRVELFLHGHLHMQETIQYKDSLIYNGGAFCGDMWRGPFHGFRGCFTLIGLPDNGPPEIKRIDLPDVL
jgi:Icc protein